MQKDAFAYKYIFVDGTEESFNPFTIDDEVLKEDEKDADVVDRRRRSATRPKFDIRKLKEQKNKRYNSYQTVLAVKTNMLSDLAITPNIEVEIPIGTNWSLNAEYMFPWFLDNESNMCYQLLSAGLEGRYWFADRRVRRYSQFLTGWFAGFYASAGLYDIQLGGDGNQGEFLVAAGISGGYTKRINQDFGIEFSLGLGYMHSKFVHYTPYEGYLIMTGNGAFNYFGPTKAKVSLIWFINQRKTIGNNRMRWR